MSTAMPPVPTTTLPVKPEEVRVYQHSSLMYWWPVWAVGYLMALLTYLDGSRAVIVPANTVAAVSPSVTVDEGPGKKASYENREVLVLPEGAKLPERTNDDKPDKLLLHMAKSKNLGVVYAVVLILTIVITNISVRGVWSVVVLVSIVLIVVLFALFDIWNWIADAWSLLRIHINAGGYFFISTVLLIIWALTILIFDRRAYVVFAPGKITICEAVGQGEQVFDTTNLKFQKLQNNFFQHWIWGLGAGDLQFEIRNEKHQWHNVAFIGNKVRRIEKLVTAREVV